MPSQTERKLAELLRRQKKEAQNLPEDLAKREAEWLEDLDGLMAWIEGALTAFKRKGLLDFEKLKIKVVEERLGEYDAPAVKILTPSGKIVRITPVGTFVVHALGRVDVVSGTERQMIARFGKGDWNIVRPKPDGSGWDSQKFNESSFFRLLTDLLR